MSGLFTNDRQGCCGRVRHSATSSGVTTPYIRKHRINTIGNANFCLRVAEIFLKKVNLGYGGVQGHMAADDLNAGQTHINKANCPDLWQSVRSFKFPPYFSRIPGFCIRHAYGVPSGMRVRVTVLVPGNPDDRTYTHRGSLLPLCSLQAMAALVLGVGRCRRLPFVLAQKIQRHLSDLDPNGPTALYRIFVAIQRDTEIASRACGQSGQQVNFCKELKIVSLLARACLHIVLVLFIQACAHHEHISGSLHCKINVGSDLPAC